MGMIQKLKKGRINKMYEICYQGYQAYFILTIQILIILLILNKFNKMKHGI